MQPYGIELQYNDREPVYWSSAERGGVSIHLYLAKNGSMYLRASREETDVMLRNIVPGDRLRLTYLEAEGSSSGTIDRLQSYERRLQSFSPRAGQRIGLDARDDEGNSARCAHPDNGSFSFMFANVPIDHARTWVMSGNESTQWHWQLADLYPGKSLQLEVVETDWWDEPPTVEEPGES